MIGTTFYHYFRSDYKVKTGIAIVTLFCFLAVAVTTAWAQREQSDFEFQYEKYRELYPAFQTAREEFLTHSTLVSQNEAVANTQALLVQRAQTLRTYFYALKFKLNTNMGVSTSEKARLSAELDNEIGWLQGHMDDLSGLKNPTLSQLFEISDRLERKEANYRILGYETLSVLLIGKIYLLNQEFTAINGELKPYIDKVKGTYLNNWLAEAQNNSYQALQAINSSESLIDEMKKGGNNREAVIRTFSQIQAQLSEAQHTLTKGVSYQKEILNDLEKKLPKPVVQPAQNATPSSVQSPEATAGANQQ